MGGIEGKFYSIASSFTNSLFMYSFLLASGYGERGDLKVSREPCYAENAIPTRSRYAAVRTPPHSMDDTDGRGWEVRGWAANG